MHQTPVPLLTLAVLLLFAACTPGYDPKTYQATFESKTGLHPDEIEPDGAFLTKTHRGYPVMARLKMGDVWGRYAARVAMGEIGRQLGRIGQFLSGSYESGGSFTGSPLDRALSALIGQPMSMFVVLNHGKKDPPMLDIVSSTSTIKPTRSLPKVGGLGLVIGETVYSDDQVFWNRIDANKILHDNLTKFRSYYVLVDERSVSFLFAGSENEWSAMIRAYPSYEDFIVAVLDTLAGIADTIPAH